MSIAVQDANMTYQIGVKTSGKCSISEQQQLIDLHFVSIPLNKRVSATIYHSIVCQVCLLGGDFSPLFYLLKFNIL